MRLALACVVLGGCLPNPTVEVDQESIEVARGLSSDLEVSIDGDAVNDLDGIYWFVDDPELATVTPAFDGRHLRIGGNLEGETVVHVSSYGQIIDIPVRIGPPAVLAIWTEPPYIDVRIGDRVEIRAKALDSIAQVADVTFDSRWTVRDGTIVNLDQNGMALYAMEPGRTSLHVTNGLEAAVVPVTVFK